MTNLTHREWLTFCGCEVMASSTMQEVGAYFGLLTTAW